MLCAPGIESSGSFLGYGLSLGIGFSYGNILDSIKSKTYIIIGGGEINEGNIWEGLLLTSQLKLNNLALINDPGS